MRKFIRSTISWVRNNKALSFIILFGAILHLSVIIPSGSNYCFNGICGDYFWGVHEHDGIWHIAVAESAFKTIPPRNPIFSGVSLSGYNSLLDAVLFLLKKIGIPPLVSYFKILPFIWFLSFTFVSIRLAKKWSGKPHFTFMFLLLNYFGASFSFIIPLIKEGILSGSSSLLSMQAILTLTNLQLAFSYVILLWIIDLLLDSKTNTKTSILFSFLIFVQWGLKFYTGLITIIILGIFFILRFVRSKKWKDCIPLIYVGLGSMFSIIINYNPWGGNSSGGSIFIFKPLALVWPLVEDRGLLYSEYWANAKYILLASSHLSVRLILLSSVLIFIFILLNLGIRVLGFIYIFQSLSKKRNITIAIGGAILVGLFFPLLYIQKGVWWNTIQFLFPTYLLLNIYTAGFISSIGNRNLRILIISLIIIVSIPYTYDALKGYISFPGQINISSNELKALAYLKKLPDGIVYVPLYSPKSYLNSDISKPLFNHVDSAYVSAYSGKQVLYANYVQLMLLNINYEPRKLSVQKGDCSLINKLDYVFINKSQLLDVFFKKCIKANKQFKKIYDFNTFLIYFKKY